jgi:hypothetical protein
MVSTRGRPVPYITVAELKRAPIFGQLKQLVPNSSDADRDAELARIIARATGMINGEVNQNLAATHDFEIGQVVVADTGDLRIHTRCSPIVAVESIAVGPTATSLVPLTDLSSIVIDPWRITVPRGAGFWGPPRARVWASWSYINGFPVTTLTQPANAGDTTITVADSTGILAGQTLLTIQDGNWLEQLVPTAVNGTVLTVPELTYPHAVGVGVSDLPEDIKEATLLLISRLHDTWSLTMNVISMDGGGSKKPPAGPARALCDAAVMLAPYRRVW